MQRQSRVAFENVRPKEGLRTEFKYQTVVFPGTKLPDNLVCVDAYMSLYTCRSASPESLSTHIVDIDTKTVTTVKTGGETQCPCLPVHSLVTSVYTFIKL